MTTTTGHPAPCTVRFLALAVVDPRSVRILVGAREASPSDRPFHLVHEDDKVRVVYPMGDIITN